MGKDGDLAVFNGHPLNSYSRVEMTLVEGEVYFQRSEKFAPFAPAVAGPARPTPLSKPMPANAEGTYAIYGATVHPVSGPAIPNALVEVRKGRITRVRPGGGEAPKGQDSPEPLRHQGPAGQALWSRYRRQTGSPYREAPCRST